MKLYIKADDYGYLCYSGAQRVPFEFYKFGDELIGFLERVVEEGFEEVVYEGDAEEGERERDFA